MLVLFPFGFKMERGPNALPMGGAGGEARGRELIFLMTLPEGYKETSLPGDWRPAAPPGAKFKYKINGASV